MPLHVIEVAEDGVAASGCARTCRCHARLRKGKGIDHAIDALDEKAHKWVSEGKT